MPDLRNTLLARSSSILMKSRLGQLVLLRRCSSTSLSSTRITGCLVNPDQWPGKMRSSAILMWLSISKDRILIWRSNHSSLGLLRRLHSTLDIRSLNREGAFLLQLELINEFLNLFKEDQFLDRLHFSLQLGQGSISKIQNSREAGSVRMHLNQRLLWLKMIPSPIRTNRIYLVSH